MSFETRQERQETLFPYLLEKPNAGKSYQRVALTNWLILIALIFGIRPFFLSKKEGNIPVVYAQEQDLINDQSIKDIVSYSQPQPTQVIEVIPTKNIEITPTITQVYIEPELILLKLSFYDPEIGRYYPESATINCSNWSYEKNTCLSVMANGKTYKDYYGKGAACPPGMVTGQLFKVFIPDQLKGIWECTDRGGAIQDGWIDFLLRYPDNIWTGYDINNFPWGSPVVIQLIDT